MLIVMLCDIYVNDNVYVYIDVMFMIWFVHVLLPIAYYRLPITHYVLPTS